MHKNNSVRITGRLVAVALLSLALGGPVAAQTGGPACLQFDTELVSMSLTGGPFPMPLAADPGNRLGDSIDGYGFVDSRVQITLSSQRLTEPGPASEGTALAYLRQLPGTPCDPVPVNPSLLDGEMFAVESFFDVFFDITVTDVDPRPGRDFAGMPDGTSVALPDNGPVEMRSFYAQIFQAGVPSFGLVPPPQAAPHFGFRIEIPLGGDINGNGENDKIKFTLVSNAAGDENRTFIVLPDGAVLHEFDSAAFLHGAVVDESTDPPFTLGSGTPSTPAFTGPGALTGPTAASSDLLNPVLGRDHYLHYQVKETRGFHFRRRTVLLRDQFGRGEFRVDKPVGLYNPADKNHGGITDPVIHLAGYRIHGPQLARSQRVLVQDQFGTLVLELKKPELLLVPAHKNLEPLPLPPPDPATHAVDHFLCYDVKDRTEEVTGADPAGFPTVLVRDQFDEKLFEVVKPEHLCTPVDKEGEGIKDESRHLMCYQVRKAKGEERHDRVQNVFLFDQFGVLRLETKKERELCLPATKTVLPR